MWKDCSSVYLLTWVSDHLNVSSNGSTPGCWLLLLLGHAFDEASEHVHVGRHNCVCVYRVQRSRSCIFVSREWSEGRCWRRLEDRRWWVVGWKRGEGRESLVCRSRARCYGGETNWSDSDKWTISSSCTDSLVPCNLLSAPSVSHCFLKNVCSPFRFPPTNIPRLSKLCAVELYPLTSWPSNYQSHSLFKTPSEPSVNTLQRHVEKLNVSLHASLPPLPFE